jgi:mannose/fructose/N-acetylgalactosamine-specific phosphotransferase system component IID/mannose/fructose/N-acetylgalactosamine-specific phosphotransferase system component IIC
VSIFQAILIGLVYYLSNSPWPFGGLGNYAILYRPMIGGFVVGLILGDPVQGTIIGATINLMYIGFISAGGSMPSDMSLAGILGTALAITGGLETEAALAIAVPLGLVGAIFWVGSMTICTAFVPLADKLAEQGKADKVWIPNVLLPQLIKFALTFFPSFLAAYFGGAYIQGFINALGGNVLRILSIIGGMLPAVGIALTLLAIFKGKARIFFFFGFLLAAYFNIPILPLSLLFLCITIIYMQLQEKAEEVKKEFVEEAVSAEPKNESLLTKKDLVKSWLTWMYYFQSCYNYERMQGVGFLHSMSHLIKRLYKDNPEERSKAMKRHVQFINTENAFGSAIIGLTAAMEEQKAQGADLDDESFTSIKTGLMGPLAGIGDPLWQGVAIPLLIVFFLGMAIEGSVAAPILYSIVFFAIYYGVGYWLMKLGYEKGSEKILEFMESGTLKKVIAGAGIIGNGVIGGLVANYVSVQTAIQITQSADNVFVLQTELFDKIMPGILALALTMFCYWLLKKKVSSLKVILIVAAIGIVGGLIGVF